MLTRRLPVIAFVVTAVFLSVLFMVPVTFAKALSIPPTPTLSVPVVDSTGTLSAEQIQTIATTIDNPAHAESYQIAVLVISSLNGNSIEQYSIDVARNWGIGVKGKNNGVLLIVAKDDRRLRIEVGSGLEGDITDAQSNRIITGVITPEFKKADYFNGINKGVQSISALASGQDDPNAGTVLSANKDDLFNFIMVFGWPVIFFAIWVSSILGRSKSWWAGGVVGGAIGLASSLFFGISLLTLGITAVMILLGLLLDRAVSKNYLQHKKAGTKSSWWAGGGGFGGGSSGGGGSFGGGGFSGGGSSGSW